MNKLTGWAMEVNLWKKYKIYKLIEMPVKINYSAMNIFCWKIEQPKSVICTLSKMLKFQNLETWEFFRPRTTLRVSSPGGWCDHSFLSDHDDDDVVVGGADDD